MRTRIDPPRTGNSPNTGGTTRPGSRFAIRAKRFSVFAACVAVTAGASVASAHPAARPAPRHNVAAARQTPSLWPDLANYRAIVIAVKVRDQALHLRAWNQKSYAAQLALETLATLAGTMLPGKCASFVAHIYDELADLSEAYAGENWQPLVEVVAHDPTARSQCSAPRAAHIGPKPKPGRTRTSTILTG
jgi:hypothetical protein